MRVKYNKDKTRDLLDIEVVRLAQEVLNCFGFRQLDEKMLLSEFRKVIPMPLILSTEIMQIWIDKYYIAYSCFDVDAVCYVYIAEKHISEEADSIEKIGPMYRSILEDFSLAKLQMQKTKKRYAIFIKRIVKDS
jgi:hypothetical protein